MSASSSSGKSWLQTTLQGKGEPVIQFLDEEKETFLSAANLYNLAIEKYKTLRRQGIKPESGVLSTSAVDPDFVTLLMAAMCGGYWLNVTSEKDKLSETQPAASLPPGGGLILSTSGSTSTSPRMVSLTWNQVFRQVQAHDEELYKIGFLPGVRLSILPKHHCFGLIVDFLVSLTRDPVVLLTFCPESATRKLKHLIQEFDVRALCLTPRLIEVLLDGSSKALPDFKNLQILCGGASLPEQLRLRAESTFARFVEGYGQTECGPGVLLNGVPLPFCEVQIEREKDSLEIGRLMVKTTTLGDFPGKVLNENGFFDTGDLAFEKDGKICILGRTSEFIKNSSGKWTSLQVEKNDVSRRFGVEVALEVGSAGEILMTVAIENQSLTEKIQEHLSKRYYRSVVVQFGSVFERQKIRSRKESSYSGSGTYAA